MTDKIVYLATLGLFVALLSMILSACCHFLNNKYMGSVNLTKGFEYVIFLILFLILGLGVFLNVTLKPTSLVNKPVNLDLEYGVLEKG